MRKLLLTLACLLLGGAAWADKKSNDTITVHGEVIDNFTRELVDSVFIEVLMPDSTTVIDTVWNKRPKNDSNQWWNWEMPGYTTKLPQYGHYLMRCTKLGYKPSITALNVPRKRYNKKVKEWEHDPILLKKSNSYDFDSDMKEVTVTATRIKMFQDGDTVVYNADAFELSDGSMLDELIRQLPGVELKDGGQIYVNGNKVNELLLNGKHFFQGDAKVALDNLPAYMVQNVKAYQRADDKAYLDKHHEDMKKKDPWVIDVNLKRQYNTGWIGNVEGGYGTSDHYLGRLFLTRFTDHSRITAYANANNINNQGQPGSEGSWMDWSSPNGQIDNLSAGLDVHVDSKMTKDELNAQLTASRTKTTSRTDQTGVTFLTTGDVFNRNHSQNESTASSIGLGASFQMPRKESFFMFNPNISYTYTKNNGFSSSGTFSKEPEYTYKDVSIRDIYARMGSAKLDSILTNRTLDQTKGTNTSLNAGINTFYYTVAPWNGEMITIGGNFNYSHSEGKDYSQYDLRHPATSASQNQYQNRYTGSPTTSSSLGIQFQHNIWEFNFGSIGLNYGFNYSYNNGHRNLYRLDNMKGWDKPDSQPIGMLPSMSDSLNACIDWQNSYHTVTRDLSHSATLSLQDGGDWGYYNLSVNLSNETNRIEDTRGELQTPKSKKRNVTLPSYNAQFRYKDWDASFSYNESAPSISYLLNVRDDSNPLSVSLGNDNLKNSSIENISINYSHNSTKKQSNWHVGTYATFSQNSIGNAMTYNRETGVYTYQPWNISGNWSVNLNSSMYLPIDKNKYWTVSHSPSVDYHCSVDFLQEGEVPQTADDLQTSRVHNYTATDRLQLRFQKGNYTASLNGEANYSHATSKRENFHTINTIDFSYGVSCALKLPWTLQFDTDFTMHSRRGYEDPTMNENNLVWNAALSKSFFKGKSLIVKLIGHDILQQLSSVQRTINAQGRTETWYNTEPAYGLLTVAYRLNVMPKKKQ